MDNHKVNLVRLLIKEIGDNPERHGLVDTPERVVKMWKEIFKGYNTESMPKITLFKNGSDSIHYDQMILDTGEFHSHCEHHMLPFFGRYWFGYIPSPNGNLLGLSKIARVVDYFSSKLQIQERLVQEIADFLWEEISKGAEPPLGLGLVMEGEHLCKTMRGAKKHGKMTTTRLKGVFMDNPIVREEFLHSVRQ